MGTPLDTGGQPLNRHFNAARLSDRALDELVGMCRMASADGRIDQAEAECFMSWATQNRAAASKWPANRIYERLDAALRDGQLDAQESAELLELCQEITGGNVPIEARIASYATSLPLTKPAPTIRFEGRAFCMTGKFVFGTRRRCEDAVIALGGRAQGAPTSDTDYLVIGAVGSTDWIHSSFGRKIEAAVAMQRNSSGIAIVAEEHWGTFVGG